VEEPTSREITRRQIFIGIVSSLIATVFFLLILQPLLGLVWRFVLSNVRLINDIACRGAALENPDRYGYLLMTAVATGSIAALVLSSGIVHIFNSPPSQMPLKRSEVFPKWYERTMLFFLVFSIFSVAFVQYIGFLQMALKISFSQRLTVLTPKISDQERKELQAEWASMRNESDYIHIVDEMEQKAKANGITLPKFRTGAAPSR
jgi:hypothetical protein